MNRIDINKARIIYYQLISSLFAFEMTEKHYQDIVHCVDILKENPMDDESEKAFQALHIDLQKLGYQGLKNESNDVFFNPLSALVPMTASYFSEQRDDGQKRVEMTNYLLQSSFRKNEERYNENEDHIEFIALFMALLAQEEIEGKDYAAKLSKSVFATILNEMIDPFLEAVYKNQNSIVYKNAALIISVFADFERLFFDVAKPLEKNIENLAQPNIRLHKDKLPPREMVNRNLEEFVSI